MVAPKPNQQQMIALAVATIASAVDYDDDCDDALLSAQVSRLAGLVDAEADADAAAVVVAVAACLQNFLFSQEICVLGSSVMEID